MANQTFYKNGANATNIAGHTQMSNDSRIHNPSLGDLWHALSGQNPAAIMPQIVATVIEAGGTRPPWRWQYQGKEYIAVAWPQDQPLRACVLMCGEPGAQLAPVNAFPLFEGLPNDLVVEASQPLEEGQGADVAVSMMEDKNPMWFFDPFYTRDVTDLTPGVVQTFWLAGCALGIRKAVLDHISLVSGPDFELFAKDWLEKNPDKSSQDVPPLQIDIAGKHFIQPGRCFGEYHIRATVEDIEDWQFDKMPVKSLTLIFPFDNRPALRLPLYVSQYVLNGYTPQKGDDIEAYVCLQGRIIDLEATDSTRQ